VSGVITHVQLAAWAHERTQHILFSLTNPVVVGGCSDPLHLFVVAGIVHLVQAAYSSSCTNNPGAEQDSQHRHIQPCVCTPVLSFALQALHTTIRPLPAAEQQLAAGGQHTRPCSPAAGNPSSSRRAGSSTEEGILMMARMSQQQQQQPGVVGGQGSSQQGRSW
jgi:hypothetical protein